MTAPGINPISEITLPSVRRLSAFINILITRLCRLRLPSWAFLCTGHFFVAQSPAKPRKSKLEIEHQPRPHKVAILRYPFLCWNRTTRYREKKRPFRTSSSSSFSTFQERNQTTSFAESFPLIRKRRNNHHRLSIPHTHTKPTDLPLFGFPGTLFSINPSYFFPFSLQRKDFKSFIKLGQKHPFFRTENRRSWTPQTIFIWIDFIICRTESHPHINHPPSRTKLGDAAWESEEKIDILVSAKQKKLRRTFFFS